MIYNLENENEKYIFKKQVEYLIENKKICELKGKKKTRSLLQNSALHLYFDIISHNLNEIGLTYMYRGLNKAEIEMQYTAILVKEMIWRPIQIALFEKQSTTELTTIEINTIIDVLSKFFSERGVYIPFPSIQSLIDKYEETKNSIGT
jgi:hypothetical protein